MVQQVVRRSAKSAFADCTGILGIALAAQIRARALSTTRMVKCHNPLKKEVYGSICG